MCPGWVAVLLFTLLGVSAGGADDADTVRVLSTPDDLDEMRTCPSCKFQLSGDIDLTGTTWTPIPSFSGVLNGMGHVISGLALAPSSESPAKESAGFFATTEGATLIDLVVDLATDIVVAPNKLSAVGGLVGAATNTRFYGVYAKGSLSLGADALAAEASVGGVVGSFDYAEGAFDDVYTNVAVTVSVGDSSSGLAVGGVVGTILAAKTTRNLNCGAKVAVRVSTGAQNQNAYVGGLIGVSKDDELVLYNCRCPGSSVSLEAAAGMAYVGSVAGAAAAGSGLRTGTKQVSCVTTGPSTDREPSGTSTSVPSMAPGCVIGGLVGHFTGRGEIYSYDLRSAAAVKVSCSGTRGCTVGGLVGRSDQNIRNSSGYSTLSVSGSSATLLAGGVVGHMTGDFRDVSAFGSGITVSVDGSATVSVGGLAGVATSLDTSGLTMENCLSRVPKLTISGASSDLYLGGLVGITASDDSLGVKIRDSAAYHSTLSISGVGEGSGSLGGLVGFALNTDIDHCYSIGGSLLLEASGASDPSDPSFCDFQLSLGGLIGNSQSAAITHSFAQAQSIQASSCSGAPILTLDSPKSRVGGLVGASQVSLDISACYSNVKKALATGLGPARMGGLIGLAPGLHAFECFSLAEEIHVDAVSMSGSVSHAVGLFAGEVSGPGSSIDGSWAQGLVDAAYGDNPAPEADDPVAPLAMGGFLGIASRGVTVSNCYVDAALTVESAVDHVAGALAGYANGLNAYSTISVTSVSLSPDSDSGYDWIGKAGSYQVSPYGFHSCIMSTEVGITELSVLAGVFATDPSDLAKDVSYAQNDLMLLSFSFSDDTSLWAKEADSPPVLRRLAFPCGSANGLCFSSLCEDNFCWAKQGWALSADLFSGHPYFAPGEGGPNLCDSYLSGCRGTVVDPVNITCQEGLRGEGCDKCDLAFGDQGCTGHGTCNENGACTCQMDWSGFLCDTPKCYFDQATGIQCGEGSCQKAGDFFKCVCPNSSEYTLANGVCKRSCPGYSNAICISDQWGDGSLSRAVCLAGYSEGSLCGAFDCELLSEGCGGLGTCDSGTRECYCSDTTQYYNHTEARCVVGCESMDPQHGACVEIAPGEVRARCFNGWTGPTCANYNCNQAKTDICGGLGSCEDGACKCVRGAVRDEATGSCRPGIDGCQHGISSSDGKTCLCDDGWADPPAVASRPGTHFGKGLDDSCSVFNCSWMETPCGGHGECDEETGACSCDPDSTRYWETGSCFQDCPGMLHGRCLPMGVHRCEAGWYTASEETGYCNVYNCHLAESAGELCGGHGTCGVSGCLCDEGFVLINGTCNPGCPGKDLAHGTCLGDGKYVCEAGYSVGEEGCLRSSAGGSSPAVIALAVLFALALVGLIVALVFLFLTRKRYTKAKAVV